MDERDMDFLEESLEEKVDNAIGRSDETTYLVIFPVHVRARHAVFSFDDLGQAIAKARELVDDGVDEIKIYESKQVYW